MPSYSEALQKMKHIETKSLIVEKRNDDDEYGMVLLSDIAKDVLAKDRSPERVNIYEIMYPFNSVRIEVVPLCWTAWRPV